MKADWRKVEIGTLGKVITGKTPPTKEEKYFDGEFPFVSPKDLNANAKYVESTGMTITQLAIEKFPNQVLPKNSILFTSLSYGFGKMGVTRETCLTNQQIHSIVVDESKYDFHFIYYAIRHNTPTIRSYDSGVVTPIVPKSTFCKIKIDIPSLPTQQKIANILSAYDDLIENNTKRIELLEEQAQLIYEKWFVRMRFPNHENTKIDVETGLPEGWEIVTVNSLLAKAKSTKKIKKSEILDEGTIPVIDQSRDFISGFTDDIDALVETEGPIIVFGDHTRVLKLVNFDFARGADGTQLIISNSARMPQHLFYHVLQALDLSNYHYARHFKYLKSEEVVLPDVSTASSFESFVSLHYQLIQKLRLQNQKLKEARDILLPRLMMGIIEV